MSRSMCRRSVASPNRPSPDEGEEEQGQGPPLAGAAAGERRDRADHGGEAGRRGPRGAGVLRLEEERRDPRQERQAADHDRHQGGTRARAATSGRPARPGRPTTAQRRGQQVEGPVVGVEEQPGDRRRRRRGCRRGARAAPGRGPGSRRRSARRPASTCGPRCRSGPRTATWPRGAWRPRRRCGRRAACRPARPGARVATPNDARQGPHGDVRRPEHRHPEVEQDVEERRGAVPLEVRGDLVQRQAGDVDGQRLVEPQVGPGPEAQHQPPPMATTAADDQQDRAGRRRTACPRDRSPPGSPGPRPVRRRPHRPRAPPAARRRRRGAPSGGVGRTRRASARVRGCCIHGWHGTQAARRARDPPWTRATGCTRPWTLRAMRALLCAHGALRLWQSQCQQFRRPSGGVRRSGDDEVTDW